MTLIKSLLLGSAAALVVVAGAQAADLPTKKGAPAVEYVKVCHIDGMAGFVIPGSDTCLKITGYITAQMEAGNLTQAYGWSENQDTIWRTNGSFNSKSGGEYGSGEDDRDGLGWTTRGELEFIAKTNTAYGVLTSDIDTQFNYGSGFDNTGAGSGFINHAYLTWAGLTAGKQNSFFSFFGGGEGWANIFSPDRQGFNQPLLLAYTATFGGGFSATLSLEDPNLSGPSGGGTEMAIGGNSVWEGQRWPDIVASIDLAQGWGGAHLAGVAHNVRMINSDYQDLNVWGWAIDGGLKFNLPTLGAGDNIQLQGVWSRNAVWYSGIPDGFWGENGAPNGNGLSMPVADAYSNYDVGNTWATPTAWSITALGEFHFGPTFSIDPEISYAELHWSGLLAAPYGQLSANSESWIGGAVFHWDPHPQLDFNLELLYQNTHQSMPTGFYVPNANYAPWQSNSSGLEGRFEITRSF